MDHECYGHRNVHAVWCCCVVQLASAYLKKARWLCCHPGCHRTLGEGLEGGEGWKRGVAHGGGEEGYYLTAAATPS